MKKASKTFAVTIRWGTAATREEIGGGGYKYEFETKAELDAFMLGVEQATGWLDYETID